MVLDQDPLANTLVTSGDTVTLTVSSGPKPPKPVLLPPVQGDSLTVARTILQPKGFIVKVLYQETRNPAILVGTVLVQSPQWNLYYPLGSTVTLTVAHGPQPVAVPSKGVVGEPVQNARNALLAAGFNVSLGTSQFSSTVPVNDVITTTPAPGTLQPPDSTIFLVVSEGPAVNVPNVFLKTQTRAETILSNAHLTYAVQTVDTSGYLPGVVTSQSPAAGTPVKPGTTVILYVEQGATTTTTTSTSTTTTSTSTTTSTTTPPTTPPATP